MLLLTYRAWFGPSREALHRMKTDDAFKDTMEIMKYERIEGWVTRLPLEQAVLAMRDRNRAMARRYKDTASEHSLVGVQVIDDLSDEAISAAGVHVIEDEARSATKEAAEHSPWVDTTR